MYPGSAHDRVSSDPDGVKSAASMLVKLESLEDSDSIQSRTGRSCLTDGENECSKEELVMCQSDAIFRGFSCM